MDDTDPYATITALCAKVDRLRTLLEEADSWLLVDYGRDQEEAEIVFALKEDIAAALEGR